MISLIWLRAESITINHPSLRDFKQTLHVSYTESDALYLCWTRIATITQLGNHT